jgi:hypothetical protein
MSDGLIVVLVCGGMALFLALYDLVVPRVIPCGPCGFYLPGCGRTCGALRRYAKLMRRRDAALRLFLRIGKTLGRLAKDLSDSDREGAPR